MRNRNRLPVLRPAAPRCCICDVPMTVRGSSATCEQVHPRAMLMAWMRGEPYLATVTQIHPNG